MPDEKPIVITKQRPGEAPQFERDLEDRVNKAREQFQQSHSELFGPPPAAAAPTEAPATPEPEAPPMELPTADEGAPAGEPAITPSPVAEPSVPAPAPSVPTPEPVPPPAPAPPPDNAALIELRRIDRENRRLRRELEEAKKGTPAAAKPEAPAPATAPAPAPAPESAPADDDPFGIKAAVRDAVSGVKAEYEQREQERFARDQENEQRRYAEELDRSEREFAAKHPDYKDAVDHIANWERQRYQLSGAAMVKASEMMRDPKWHQTIEKVADEFVFVPDPKNPATLLTARRDQLTLDQRAAAREMSDAEAAVCLATDLWISERRNDILQGARLQRKAVPEVVWELATKVAGYSPRGVAPQASPQEKTSTPASTAEKIRQAARVNAASKSLSGLSGGAPSTGVQPQVRSLAEWAAWHRKDPAAARAYADRMSRINPRWQQDLQA